MSEERNLVPKEFALEMGVSLKTVYHWIKDEYIKAQRRGPRLWFIPESEVLRVRRG